MAAMDPPGDGDASSRPTRRAEAPRPGIRLTTALSDESKRAFAPVRELAKRLQLDVTLLAVMEEPL
ncbi:MAG: hypothetical protein ACK6D1_06290, partial [Planctomycetota bacterium]